jgi:hypothetical protein
MSGYTFRIWFSGLCHFVPNRDLGARCQLCVVLPRAEDGECAHRGTIHTVAHPSVCGTLRVRPKSLLKNLEYERVTFRIQRVDDFPQPTPPDPGFPAGVINMDQIAGPFVDENPDIVSRYPDRTTVLAQVLFENGYSSRIDDASVQRTWHLPGTLTDSAGIDFKIADPVLIEYSGVKSVEIHTHSIESSQETWHYELKPNTQSAIEILISNRCYNADDDTPRHLTWSDIEHRLRPDGFDLIQIDKDFAFNYRMLHPSTLTSLRKFLPSDSVQDNQVPRYPVPESPLLSVTTGLPFCPDEILAGLTKLLAGYPESKTAWDNLDRETRENLKLRLLDLVPTGTGTGSGSDCLGASGLMRFVDLDTLIPNPVPAAPASPLAANHSASSGGPTESGVGRQVRRSHTSPVPAEMKGGPSAESPSSQPRKD